MVYYNSIPLSIVFADRENNIGYALMAATPYRKSTYTFVGSKVLDGSKGQYDWVGLART